MTRNQWISILCLAGLLAAAPDSRAQRRPYIGFAYPAGGEQGSTFEVRLGGQNLTNVHAAVVTGHGVTAKLRKYERRLSPQDINLLREQLKDLKASLPKPPPKPKAAPPTKAKPKPKPSAKPKPGAKPAPKQKATPPTKAKPKPGAKPAPKPKAKPKPAPKPKPAARTTKTIANPAPKQTPKPVAKKPTPPAKPASKPKPAVKQADPATLKLIAKIEKRIKEWVNRPAVQSISNLAFLEVTIASDAAPGERELRLVTPQGVSNPLPFHIGQFPEYRRQPMRTSFFQVLGKEWLAKRKRPAEEIEAQVALPCTVNGQVASGEVNLYRFKAGKGQKLVFSTVARQLVPYIADAVPGWFQPVLRLCDAAGREVAYVDDFRFNPDPTIFYEVPKDGEYVLGIYDSIYRGREDFVYRITMGELPFVTHIFPMGGKAGTPASVTMEGWNLDGAKLTPPDAKAAPGRQSLTARMGKLVSNAVPFALDTLPECFDKEPNNAPPAAQKVTLPVIVNGRIDQADDWDVFEFSGSAGETVVAEVTARRLGSPTDSSVKLTDAKGTVLAFNDDSEDRGSGLNTHHADSYLTAKLPANGTYRVHIGETARNGGEEFGYRLRLGAPQPDFALRVVPSSMAIRSKSATRFTVYAIRKDGFNKTIKLGLKDAPEGFTASPVSLVPGRDSVSFTVKTALKDTGLTPVQLHIEGVAGAKEKPIARLAVPAEDRMQAFLWRHLVPAEDLRVLVYDPTYKPPPKRVPPIKVSLK